MKKLHYLVGLSRISGLGPRRYKKLMDAFGTPEGIWLAKEGDVRRQKGLGEKFIAQFLEQKKSIDLVKELERVEGEGIKALDLDSPSYPPLLKNIYDPPFLLYTKGQSVSWTKPWVAVVGSRKMTAYGKEIALWLGRELASMGIGVVSGLARGIDTWAHKGALQGNGETAAVLGCGLDICYPPENRELLQEVAASGQAISEFAPGVGPKPHHFPLRNRIISGISLGTVVVEAAEKSGALITADSALEQGREVFAVPGPITSPASKGCHGLIKQGAKLVADVDDLLEELAIYKEEKPFAKPEYVLTEEERELMEFVPYHPVSADYLTLATSWPTAKVKATLTLLEMKGMITQDVGNYFLRIK